VVSRNTLTHEIVKVDMVSNIVKEMNL